MRCLPPQGAAVTSFQTPLPGPAYLPKPAADTHIHTPHSLTAPDDMSLSPSYSEEPDGALDSQETETQATFEASQSTEATAGVDAGMQFLPRQTYHFQQPPPFPASHRQAPQLPASHCQLPPPLTPHYTHPRPSTGGDIMHLIQFLEQSRIRDEDRRRREDEIRRQEEDRRRQEEEDRRRQEEDARLAALLQMLAPAASPPVTTTTSTTGDTTLSLHTSQASSSTCPSVPPPQKAIAQNPPPLHADATFQVFREWRRRWDDYAVMVDLSKLPRQKQLIQLRMSLTLETQRILEHTLDIPPDTDKTVEDVLDVLQEHIKNLRNEALRRRELLSCKQLEGESFSAFYVRLKHIAEEVDICPGSSSLCEETQLKMIILMGVRDEELVQKLISLDTTASLQDVVNTCRSYEAARKATSDIRSPGPRMYATSTYKKQKGYEKAAASISSSKPPDPCQSCARLHASSAKCPAVDSTCKNCGRKGHWARTQKCPAATAQCRACSRIGHFDKCCRSGGKAATQRSSPNDNTTTASHKPQTQKKPSCRRVGPSPTETSQPVCISLSHGSTTSHIYMLPDTGADITIMGPQHLDSLHIPRTSLQPPPSSPPRNADNSPMAPALGTFRATLTLGKHSCSATIQVNRGIQIPLLSLAHCKELAIVSSSFPKQISEVIHVNRCTGLPLPPTTSPAAAKQYFLKEFKDVLVSKEDLKTAPLKPMAGPPMRIHLKEGAAPFAINTPRQIPFAYRSQVKDELDSMVAQGIIKPAGDEPSEWCHPLVVVPKHSGVRITVDLTKLNSQVSRPTHPSPTPFAAIRSVDPKARYFTTADALCGYWQLHLAEEDQRLTTFITPYGRFQHCRGPMGFAAIGDAYCLRGDMALQGLQNCVKVVDDILMYDEDYPTHLRRIYDMLARCRANGITLNREKFVVAAPRVNFCGYQLSDEGISADPEKVTAIRDFPTPTNLTDLRSFMGLVNQLAEFTPDIAATAQPLRPLMSPKRAFLWTPDHDEAFRQVKAALLSPPVLASFDPDRPVILQTDASRLYGIGYALLQDHGNGRLRLVQCGSRFLADAETRYATIELEMLAVVWAMSKCRLYLSGLQHFTLMSDHRPLIPILNHYSLDAIENPRLQRLKEKIAPYLYTAVWRAGKQLSIPDALSRAPVSHPTPEDETACADSTAHLRAVISVNAVASDEDVPPQDSDRTLQDLREAARLDPSYSRLRDCVTSGFPPNRYDLHNDLLPFWKLRDSLSTDGELVLYGPRIVVPAALRRRTLARLHDSHRGVEATKRRARQTVFWPGIDSDVTNTVRDCEPCQVLQPSLQQEPLLNDDHPTRPFESVSADFFSVSGKSFLVVTDRLSGWPVVVPCKGDTTASNTIRIFCRYFREVGVPLRLRTDGGPQFTSRDFEDFLKRWGVHHVVSSPHYPQSNGHAEAAVKSVKHLILKTAPSGNIDNEDFDRGLLELRNTPGVSGRSPAQVLYGRPLRSCVPAHPESFSEEWQAKSEDCDRRAAARAQQIKSQYDQHARPLSRLSIGQTVRIQDPISHRWNKVGVVMSCGRSRDYEVRLPSGRVWWRNRRFLRPVPFHGVGPLPHIPVVPCSDTEKSLASSPPVVPRRSPRLLT